MLGDFQRAKSSSSGQLKLTNSFLQRLPWLLSALAHYDEQVAMSFAGKILQQWRQDPRRESHHRITWRLLKPGSVFLWILETFAQGTPLSQLHAKFQSQVARYRFPACVETTIEEKHAKVTLAKRVHHIGPVRISLANRLPLLGRWTQRGEIDGNTLLNAFSLCRSLKSVPAMLGLDEHPALVEGRPWSMRVSLARVLYHCDLESMFESHELQKKHDAKRKRQALAEEARLLKAAGRGKQDLTYSRVLKGAMEDHFAKQHGNTNHVFYAAPRACVTVTQLEEVLQEPPSKRARLQADSEDEEEEGMALPEDLDASSANVADPLLYFQVSLLAPSEKRVVRVHVGAGGRVQTGVAVTIHGTIDSAASAPNSATVA